MQRAPVLLVFADPVLYPAAQPYGATIIAAALRDRGVEAEILLPYLAEDPVVAVRDACRESSPQLVGFSFRNLDTAGFHYTDSGEEHFLGDLSALVEASREATPDAVVAIGGSGFTIAPAHILEHVAADVGFVGSSEHDFAVFCERLMVERKSVALAVEGLDSAFLPGGAAPRPPRAALGQPERLDVLGIEYARLVGGTVPVRTKTGCTLRCSYCVVPSIEALNLRSWEDIRRELRMVQDAGLGERIFIADGEFNLPSQERAIELCRQIEDEFGDSLRWTCYLEAGYVTDELVQAMRGAGCAGVSLTVDSYSRPGRIGFAKGTKPRTAIEATELCLASGVRTQVNLLFGGPRETVETARETAEMAAEINSRGAAVAVTIGLRVYPNTPLARMVELPRYAPFFRPLQSVSWLGTFCSPLPAIELAPHIVEILPPSDTVAYTSTVTQADQAYFRRLAVGAGALAAGDFEGALRHFEQMEKDVPNRLEPTLGVRKAQLGLLTESR